MKNTRKKCMVLCLASVLGIGTIGEAYSYFTNVTDPKRNVFSIAEGGTEQTKGEIIEEGWDAIKDSGEVTDLQPGEIITKDPKYKSAANYPTYVYAEVTVPAVKSTAGDTIKIGDETAGPKTPYVTLLGVGDHWTLLGTDDTTTDGAVLYVYGYQEELPALGMTETIFTSFQVADFTEFPAEESAQQIDVTVRTVQAYGQSVPSLDNYKTLFGQNDNLS